MAKQKSHVKYTGSLGEIRHFKIKGKEGYFAALKGGVDKEVILSDPRFARTRENMQEFGGAARAGKALRQGFPQLVKQMGGTGYTGRITGLLKQVMNLDTTGVRGQRLISVVGHPQWIQGFELNPARPFGTVCRIPLDLAANVDRNEVTWTIAPFEPVSLVTWPEGATHYRLILAVATLSDYGFDTTLKEYAAVNPSADQEQVRADSGHLPVHDPVTSAITLTATLPSGVPTPADVAVIVATAIEFTQEVNGVNYPLNDGHAMQLARVF